MSVKDSVLLIKLKDGIQDTVVFLRMLEQFKIPAVMETRRKKLLQKLLHLQGDTIRETPPSYENGDATSPTHEQGEAAKRISVVDSKVSEYARIQTKAKEEMATFSPKKAAGAVPEVAVEEEPPANEGTDYLEPASVLKREKKEGDDSGAAERPASNESEAAKKEETEVESGAAAAAEGKGKKKRFGGGGLKGLRNKIGKRGKKTGQNVSVVSEADGGEPENGEQGDDSTSLAGGEGEGKEEEKEVKETASAEGAPEKEEEVEEEEQEEGVRITSALEKRMPKRLGKGFNWIKISGKLKETTLILVAGSKDKELELVGCMVSPSDAAPNGIELFNHKEQKQWVFRVETSELRERWVEELQKAIDACPTEPARPALEEPEEPQEEQRQQSQPGENPDIVIDPSTTSDEETTSPLKNKRTSFSMSPNRTGKSKPVNEIPEQGVQMRGYVHRKKGTFGGWERAYAVVTYAAIYFTSGEEVKEYHHVCLLSGSGTVKLEKKGHDKQSEGLLVRSGKNKETLSLPSSEVQSWKHVMEGVLGVSQGSLEIGSDEEEGAESVTPTNAPTIEEDQGLYEELPAGDEIEIDEDIYEEFDDVKPSSSPPDRAAPPSLPPPRQEQRLPSPALPPRNDPSSAEPVPALPARPSPSLPPRNSPTQTKDIPQTKKSAAPPPSQQPDVGEELYEDVVAPSTSVGGADIADEMYEDVVSSTAGGGEGGGEELYEDVVSVVTKDAHSPTEDYTEMDIGQGQAEDYVLMEKGGEEDLEVYCEVDPNSPTAKSPPVNSLSLPPRSVAKPAAVSKIVKPPPPASYTPRHSGSISHKAPQKSKFYEEWCAVEGTNLCLYKNQRDRRTSDKLSLSEFDMVYRPAGKDGKFAFRLSKGDKVHHFTPTSKEDLTSWISALRGLAKTATLELPSGEQEIYETTQDHTAESDEQISFKAGSYLRVISRDASSFWIGQLGSTPQVFTGKIGKFPTSKVTLAEDLYI